jgi:tetratricopeptide (TPR) repeat protein
MKKYSFLFLIFISVILCASAIASPISDLQARVDQLGVQLRQVEQNTNNYQIERDLLKETYSNNFQTINTVLTIILGVFSIIGFFGIRDISSLRNEYKKELDQLNNARQVLDAKIAELSEKQAEIVEDNTSISKISESQDKRIKILELQEKASTLLNQNNPQRALEYLAIGHDLDPENVLILNQQANCFWRLRNYSSAIQKFERLAQIDTANEKSYKTNLLELYLFNSQFDKFDQTNVPALTDGMGTELSLSFYLDCLKKFTKGEVVSSTIKSKLQSITNGQTVHFAWGFSELNMFLSTKPDSLEKRAIMTLANVIQGQKLPSVGITEIE